MTIESDSARPRDDSLQVIPPIEADPLFVEAVDDAVVGDALADSPEAQPERRLGQATDFSSLYIRHRSSLAIHARRFLSDQRDVDEVVQETFLRLFLAIPEIETELQALAFARRTLTNLCIDRYRAERRRPRLINLDDSQMYDVGDEPEGDPVLRAEDAAIVRHALALLSPLHRAALVKREIEEKPLPQIAAELDVPEESVKHLLYRARRALRRLLVGTSVEPGIDLTAGQVASLVNRRMGRAVIQSAQAVIVLVVGALVVALGIRPLVDGNSRPLVNESVGGTPLDQSPAPSPSDGGTAGDDSKRAGVAGHQHVVTPVAPPSAAVTQPSTTQPPSPA